MTGKTQSVNLSQSNCQLFSQLVSQSAGSHLPVDHVSVGLAQALNFKLGECRTLWDEREQAIHCFNLYFSKDLVSDHSTQVVWHVAEQKLVTLLSTKVLNSLEKMVAETSLSWGGTIQIHAVNIVQPKHLLV